MNFFKLFFFCSLFSVHCSLLFSGCGYSTRSAYLAQTKNICVQNFINKIDTTAETSDQNVYKTYKPKLEIDITNAIINRFIYDGNMRPSKEEDADFILKGQLVNFKRDVARYTDDGDIQEYRLSVIIDIQLLDKKQNKILWEENGFTGDTTYFLTGPLAKSESTALTDAISDLATRVVERTVEGW